MKNGFSGELDIHAKSLQEAKEKVDALVAKSSTDKLQDCLDELNQSITNYTQSATAMKKLATCPQVHICSSIHPEHITTVAYRSYPEALQHIVHKPGTYGKEMHVHQVATPKPINRDPL